MPDVWNITRRGLLSFVLIHLWSRQTERSFGIYLSPPRPKAVVYLELPKRPLFSLSLNIEINAPVTNENIAIQQQKHIKRWLFPECPLLDWVRPKSTTGFWKDSTCELKATNNIKNLMYLKNLNTTAEFWLLRAKMNKLVFLRPFFVCVENTREMTSEFHQKMFQRLKKWKRTNWAEVTSVSPSLTSAELKRNINLWLGATPLLPCNNFDFHLHWVYDFDVLCL